MACVELSWFRLFVGSNFYDSGIARRDLTTEASGFALDECEILDLRSSSSEGFREHKERRWLILFVLDFDTRVFENCGKIAIECAINLAHESQS